MKNSTMRPAAYLKDLPPAYQLNFEVSITTGQAPLQLFAFD